jgi:hypothetical protein
MEAKFSKATTFDNRIIWLVSGFRHNNNKIEL